jgi:hypothetical protein
MGILESDLPNLPHKLLKWRCICDGCRGVTKLRDYGISPIYYWPVKVRRYKNKAGEDMWRGGWTNLDHGYICGKHWHQYKLDPDHFYRKYLIDHLKTSNPNKISAYLFGKVFS